MGKAKTNKSKRTVGSVLAVAQVAQVALCYKVECLKAAGIRNLRKGEFTLGTDGITKRFLVVHGKAGLSTLLKAVKGVTFEKVTAWTQNAVATLSDGKQVAVMIAVCADGSEDSKRNHYALKSGGFVTRNAELANRKAENRIGCRGHVKKLEMI